MRRRLLWPTAIACVLALPVWALRDFQPPFPNANVTALATNGAPATNPASPARCAYAWAYQSLPELSTVLAAQLRAHQEVTAARAEAFGEDCVGPGGERRFISLETDYHISIQAPDLGDQTRLGNLMGIVMEAVDSLPPSEIPGAQPGFVELRFVESEDEFLVVRIAIAEYAGNAYGLTGAALFQRFVGSQP